MDRTRAERNTRPRPQPSFPDEADTPRQAAERNPLMNHEVEALDSGDQIPDQAGPWGGVGGFPLFKSQRKERWLHALRRLWQGDEARP
jgi:hypothetical protein